MHRSIVEEDFSLIAVTIPQLIPFPSNDLTLCEMSSMARAADKVLREIDLLLSLLLLRLWLPLRIHLIFCKNLLKGHRDDNRAGAIKQYNIKDTSIVMVG